MMTEELSLRPGQLLANRFVIEQHIGSGGMGVVLRARDNETGKPVAFKVLHSTHNDRVVIERFLREARVLEGLAHQSIVGHVAHGELAPGVPYLAMEWIEGEGLSARLESAGLTMRETLLVIRRMAEALAEIHRQGIIHRDIKPSNLILRNGDPAQTVILDFGVARQQLPNEFLTIAGTVLGTPKYMAPEQARGDSALTPATDIFSLGCVLFECLTGCAPFYGDHALAVLAKILFEEVPALHTLGRNIPESLSLLVESMLSKDASRRPPDGAALLTQLDALTGVLQDSEAVRSAAPAEPALTTREQQYISIVLARPLASQRLSIQDIVRAGSSTSDGHSLVKKPSPSDLLSDSAQSTQLLPGIRLEGLLDGSLIAVVRAGSNPSDQAMLAARMAIRLKAQQPEILVTVATGRAVTSERMPVGDAIERAVELARVHEQSASKKPEAALIDSITAKFITGRFVIEEGPGGTFLLLGEQSGEDASRPLLGKPTPCLGREMELAMLNRILAGCEQESQPAATLIIAPPGVGKSRLRHEFLRRLGDRADEILILIGRGDAMSAGSLYGLLSQAIRRVCAIQDGEPIAAQQEKLRARLRQHVPAASAEQLTLFIGELCGISFSDVTSAQLRAARQDPKVMSEQVTRAFIDFLRAESAARPLLLLLEDLHWGDALTVRLVHDALRALPESPIMVLATARPEVSELFPNLWSGYLQTIPLGGLSKKSAERLVTQVLGKKATPELLARIIERADGNALYLEEIIRIVAEGKDDELPETVVAMVQARLLRIPVEGRRALRAASIFGETFWRGGVITILGGDIRTQQTDELLELLIGFESIESHPTSRFPDEQEYGFRHALLREAAYGMIPVQEQPTVHCQAAKYLEARGERDPMILAEHYRRGGALESALAHYVRAAEQAYFSNDNDAVLSRIERGIECGASGATLGKLRCLQSRVYGWREVWAKAYQYGSEAIELLSAGNLWWYKCMNSMFVITSMAGMQKEFGALIARFAQSRPEPDAHGAYVEAASGLVVVLSLLGMRAQVQKLLLGMAHIGKEMIATDATTRGWMRYAQATSMRFCDADPALMLQVAREGCEALESVANLHALTLVRGMECAALLELGELEEAVRVGRKNLELARKLGDQFLLSNARVMLAQCLISESPSNAAEALEMCEEICKTSDKPIFVGRARVAMSLIHTVLGDPARAVEIGQNATQALTPIASEHVRAATLLANALRLSGAAPAARELCEQTLRRKEQLGTQGFAEVGLLLATAQARIATGALEEARTALQLGLTGLELRASRIPDSSARARYLDHPIDNAPLRKLAKELQVTAPVSPETSA